MVDPPYFSHATEGRPFSTTLFPQYALEKLLFEHITGNSTLPSILKWRLGVGAHHR